MLRSAATRVPTVCIVDPELDDYLGWSSRATENGLRLKIVPSAEAALRLARTDVVDLWVVSTTLPGLSGFELCNMLKSRSAAVPVYLVANEYTPAAEREALCQRATLFECKPLPATLLDTWLAHWRKKLRRSGTPLDRNSSDAGEEIARQSTSQFANGPTLPFIRNIKFP